MFSTGIYVFLCIGDKRRCCRNAFCYYENIMCFQRLSLPMLFRYLYKYIYLLYTVAGCFSDMDNEYIYWDVLRLYIRQSVWWNCWKYFTKKIHHIYVAVEIHKILCLVYIIICMESAIILYIIRCTNYKYCLESFRRALCFKWW